LSGARDAPGLLRDATRSLLVPGAPDAHVMDRASIERLIPHRGTSLLLDSVRHIDRTARTLVAEYDLEGGASLMAGHFPGQPVWPGLLQVEAIGQAGMLLTRVERPQGPPGVITDVLGARFLRLVRPPGRLRVVARVISEEPFDLVVGQCLFAGEVCSAAVLRGLETAGVGGI